VPRRLVPLITAALLALGAAGCGQNDSTINYNANPSSSASGGAAGAPDPCLKRAPGKANDGVNDDQGGSVPGTDACNGPGA
jgi:hypothetical protein